MFMEENKNKFPQPEALYTCFSPSLGGISEWMQTVSCNKNWSSFAKKQKKIMFQMSADDDGSNFGINSFIFLEN